MQDQNKHLFRKKNFMHTVYFKFIVAMALTFFLILLGRCLLQTSSPAAHMRIAAARGALVGFRSGVMPTVTRQAAPTVSVYFSKVSGDALAVTSPVKRAQPVLNHVASMSVVANYALQQLIAGPTLAELQAGYRSLVHQSLFGRSNCAGQQNFMLALDKKGARVYPGTVTVTLCRQIYSSGVAMDGGISAEIGATLKQFVSIRNVVILRNDGHCFGDESGVDLCLR